ncbi:MAG: SSU ribosomal protein S20P [candidate division WS6 bacterium GW2011_GWF2_39_15]|uniref:Small ribosomal subunit protein bS20 n=1 Tax=candidate division WS6 bacterium GW2011_GWF2_39_15 TaxID=1619100 RepID=A0A0G0MR48_9BACT|nr:MAG: SSU ribosomal protein S20P [candidate division WS6 bacterium GW2011_GWF2_39_15]
MANLKASIKDLRKTKKRTTFNTRLRDRIKRAVKKFNTFITKKEFDQASKLLPQLNKVLDKAAKENIMKQKTASRKVSRLSKKLNKEKSATDVKTAKKSS